MTLFRVQTEYYWACTSDEARALYLEQHPDEEATDVERVWASNNDKRYRGYVTNG